MIQFISIVDVEFIYDNIRSLLQSAQITFILSPIIK